MISNRQYFVRIHPTMDSQNDQILSILMQMTFPDLNKTEITVRFFVVLFSSINTLNLNFEYNYLIATATRIVLS